MGTRSIEAVRMHAKIEGSDIHCRTCKHFTAKHPSAKPDAWCGMRLLDPAPKARFDSDQQQCMDWEPDP